MEFGAHLPLIDFDGNGYSLDGLVAYTRAARDLGYAALAANDHVVFGRPWLDGPTALAATLADSGRMQLMTTVALPAIRGPAPLAKALSAVDLLSGGRLIAGVGAGSSARDYEAMGLPFDERWKRLDDAVKALRALWRGLGYDGPFYSTQGISLRPPPATPGGPAIWIGSWGSEAGLKRVARLGDGWLASAYNTTPSGFAEAWQRLQELRGEAVGAGAFPNALSTMWTYVTRDESAARQVVEEVLAPTLNRSPEDLAARLTIGPAESCAEKLRAYQEAGLQRVLIWPLRDPLGQQEAFMKEVVPLLA